MKTMKIFLSKTYVIIATVLIAAMVTIAGCDNSGGGGSRGGSSEGGGSEGEGDKTDPFNLSGRFKNDNDEDVNFFVKRDESSSRSAFRSARAIGPADYFVSGYLEDAGTVYELFGYYSPLSETYALSASSVDERYNIFGFFDPAEGIAVSGSAIVQSGPLGDWVTSSPIDVSPLSEAPAIAGTPEESANGFPLEMHGIWYSEDPQFLMVSTTVNAFSTVYYVLFNDTDEETGEVTSEWRMGIMGMFEGPPSGFYTEVWDEGGGIYGAIGTYPGMSLHFKAAFKIENGKLFTVMAGAGFDYEAVKAITSYTWSEFGYTRVSPSL